MKTGLGWIWRRKVRCSVVHFMLGMHVAQALMQEWIFQHETRRQFIIERFGFEEHGRIELTFKLIGPQNFADDGGVGEISTAGILFRHVDDVGPIMMFLQQPYSRNKCLLDEQKTDIIDFNEPKTWSFSRTIDAKPGFYYLYFAKCGNAVPPLTFAMHGKLFNPGPNYLSAGDNALPTIYMLTSFIFFSGFIAWMGYLRKNKKNTHKIHRMMTVLILFKALLLFAESMKFHYMKMFGEPLDTWKVAFYVLVFLQGIVLFTVLLLIGTGWSLVKGSLNANEKQIIVVVLCLQVVNNIAYIALQESSVGSQTWISWRDILHLADIICCCAVLFPIVWSIRSLRQAAGTDGKAQANLRKLVQFRSFYIIVVCYIYFTRIVVYLLAASLSYDMTWLQAVCTEGAAVAFYFSTGYKFRPQENNPYLSVPNNEEADQLDSFDADIEIQGMIPSSTLSKTAMSV